MNELTFGDAQFSITARDLELHEERPGLSQVSIAFAGDGWVLESPGTTEILGVVLERLLDFAATSAVRHWGAFAGLVDPEDVLGRVLKYGFGTPDRASGDFHRWEISSAFVRYSLSALFDHNLGTRQAIAIRGFDEETLIWQSNSNQVRVVSVPKVKFDEVIAAFNEWATIQIGEPLSGRGRSDTQRTPAPDPLE